MQTTRPTSLPNSALQQPANWAVLLAGALALAVAMGIGRFAFTPLLPLMMRDGLIDAAGGAELATANYLGYLLGALSAGRLARRPLPLLLASLAAIVALTAAAALADNMAAWASLRLGAGVASAWAMVATSAWALSTLAARAQPALGGLVYAGVGGGIALAGLLAWVLAGFGARALWAWLALAALLMAAAVATLIALQQARALLPLQPAPLLGRMTAAFALGQIAGPALVRALEALPWVSRWPAMDLGAALAAAVMLLSAAWLWRLSPSPTPAR